MRRAFNLLFPGAIVFAVAMASLRIQGSDPSILELTETYGRVVYGAGLALAWVFHRSRTFIVLLGLGAVDMALSDPSVSAERSSAYGTVLLALTGVMGLLRDRGLLSRGGLVQIAIAAATATVTTMALAPPERLEAFLAPLPLPFDPFLWRSLPASTAGAVALGVGGVAFGFWRWRAPVDRGLLWATLLMVAAVHPRVGGAHTSLMYAAAGLVLMLSVVEMSYILAYRDDLTGLPGRRALMQYLDGINGTYTIAMVDIDHFKTFNDRHGHDVGDQVLRMVASRLARTPGGAKAYRYGGEEFTLLFPGRKREDALQHLETARVTVEGSKFALRSWRRPRKKPEADRAPTGSGRPPKFLSVTVSIGMADSAGDDDAAAVVLKRADQALYRAKKKGRNQVSR